MQETSLRARLFVFTKRKWRKPVTPRSIENAWDVLYAKYPGVYEAFASFPYTPSPLDVLMAQYGFHDIVVTDVGGGTGKSAFAFATQAKRVIAIEPEAAMRAIGEAKATELGISNVTFVAGDRDNTTLPDNSVDIVTAITATVNVEEALRILKPGGIILYLDTPPGWYGGHLCSVIDHQSDAYHKEVAMRLANFGYWEFESVQEYGTTQNIVGTYGFIFGQRVIDHLEATGITAITWRIRVYHRQKEG